MVHAPRISVRDLADELMGCGAAETNEPETRMTSHESSQPRAPRRASAKSALRAILLFAGFFLANEATAQAPSVETAAKAAGLPVKSATANVNQVDIYYRDVGAGDQTVVLLHGFPETGDALAPARAEHGRARSREHVLHHRGRGESMSRGGSGGRLSPRPRGSVRTTRG